MHSRLRGEPYTTFKSRARPPNRVAYALKKLNFRKIEHVPLKVEYALQGLGREPSATFGCRALLKIARDFPRSWPVLRKAEIFECVYDFKGAVRDFWQSRSSSAYATMRGVCLGLSKNVCGPLKVAYALKELDCRKSRAAPLESSTYSQNSAFGAALHDF